jgi:hypothetical protein
MEARISVGGVYPALRKSIFSTAVVLNGEHGDLYDKVIKRTAKKFGEGSLAYWTIASGISPGGVGSQFFWNLNLQNSLRNGQRVATLSDMEAIHDSDETFFDEFCTDLPQVVLRSDVSTRERNQYMLDNLVEQVKKRRLPFSPWRPLLISGLELVGDDNPSNPYGLLFKVGKKTTMEHDERFAHARSGEKIRFGDGDKKRRVYTRNEGLSKLQLCGDVVLNSEDDDLEHSSDYGRVVLVDN